MYIFIFPLIFVVFYFLSMGLIMIISIPPVTDVVLFIAAITQLAMCLYSLSLGAFNSMVYFTTIYLDFDILNIKHSFYFFYCLECLEYTYRNDDVDQDIRDIRDFIEESDLKLFAIEQSRFSGEKIDCYIIRA